MTTKILALLDKWKKENKIQDEAQQVTLLIGLSTTSIKVELFKRAVLWLIIVADCSHKPCTLSSLTYITDPGEQSK